MLKKGAARSKFALLDHSSKRTCEISATVTVGRENTDLVFPALTSLSRQHFRIIIDDDGPWLEDLGSSNGTFLNKERLQPHTRQALFNGDSIIGGKALFTFQIRAIKKEREPAEAVEPAPAPASVAKPLSANVPLPVEIPPQVKPTLEELLAPEISLVIDKKDRRAKKKQADVGVISMLNYDPTDKKPEKKDFWTRYSGLSQQWTTLLLAAGLSHVTYCEFTELQSMPSNGPHEMRDILLRYLFAVGLTYVAMVFLQFIFVLTFARRWWIAFPVIALSIFLGTMLGDSLDEFAQYNRAVVENNLKVNQTKTALKRRPGWMPGRERAPAGER